MLEQFSGVIIGVLLVLVLALLGWVAYLTITFRKYLKERQELIKKAKGKGLDEILVRQLKRLEKSEDAIQELKKRADSLDINAEISITKVGVVRYNPFRDTGGDQSFSIALLNEKLDGVVISSMYGREGSRAFAKALHDGRSDHPLTDEENKAIEKAVSEEDKNGNSGKEEK